MVHRLGLVGVIVAAFVAGTGCDTARSAKDIPAGLVPFSGTVTLDGEPLASATITLIPTAPAGGSALDSGAVTDSNGRYELKSAEGRASGALPGEYRVVISRLTKPDGTVVAHSREKSPMQLMTEENARESLPARYSSPMDTTLTVTVPSGGGTSDFKLESDKSQ